MIDENNIVANSISMRLSNLMLTRMTNKVKHGTIVFPWNGFVPTWEEPIMLFLN